MTTSTSLWRMHRDEDGVILLESGDDIDVEAPTVQSLLVSGGAIQVDVRDPENSIRVVIGDPDVAAWWLPYVVGVRAADAVLTLDDAIADSPVVVESERGELSELAVRITFGLWLTRWWPGGRQDVPTVAEWLLDIEMGRLAFEAELLFASREPAAQMLTPRAEKLAHEFSRATLESAGSGALDEYGEFLFNAVIAALETIPVDSPAYVDLETAEQRFVEIEESVRRAKDGLLDDAFEQTLNAWRKHVEASRASAEENQSVKGVTPWLDTRVAVAAGAQPVLHETLHQGRFLIDWAAVHPRMPLADSGRWSMTSSTLTVTIKASSEGRIPVSPYELVVDVYLDGDAEPREIVMAQRGNQFEGQLDLSEPASPPRNLVLKSLDWVVGRDRTEEEARQSNDLILAVARGRIESVRSGNASGALRPFGFEKFSGE